MAARMCEIILIAILVPSGMDFRPQSANKLEHTPHIFVGSNLLSRSADTRDARSLEHSSNQVISNRRSAGRERRLRPASRPLANSTTVLRDPDGKMRIVRYNPSTSLYVDLRTGAPQSHNYFLPQRDNVPARRNAADNIVFPGPLKGESSEKFLPNIPEQCKNSVTFCADTDNYPVTYVDSVLQNTAISYQEFNSTDELDSVSIGQRIDASDEAYLCVSSEYLVFPKAAQNKDYTWMFIVNQPKFIQGVRVETCQDENQECAYSQNFPSGYKSMCKQKYIYRKLLAIDSSGEEIADNFRLPSCCSCVLHTASISSKSGFDPATQSKAVRRRRSLK